MKAAVVPAKNSVWEIQKYPDPKPGPGQVLIRMRASGICFTDVHQTRGELPGNFPRILGHEPVGEIIDLGQGVTTRKIGDRVGVPWVQITCGRCEWCQRGKPMFYAQQKGTGGDLPGGHAEQMVAYADATMLIPDKLSFEQAAPIYCRSPGQSHSENVHRNLGPGQLPELCIPWLPWPGMQANFRPANSLSATSVADPRSRFSIM